jgi:secretion/DNA translocation related CpaE-like protein
VLVGADMAEPCARAGLPRRSQVVVVARRPTGEIDGARESDSPWYRTPAWEWDFDPDAHRGSANADRADVGGSAVADGAMWSDWAAADAPTWPPAGHPVWTEARRLGAEHVAVLPTAEPWLGEQLAQASAVATPGRVVAVLGGRGGAGASVLSGALAVTAARHGLRTMLIDGDPLGGGVDLVLGWESLDGLRWPQLSQASGRVPAPALVESLPGESELVVLSWDRGEPTTVPAEAMLAALDAGRRGRDLTVVDLPRRLDKSSALALRASDQVYLVVPAELRACAAAGRVAATVAPHCAALSVVVRQPGPGGLSVKEVVEALGLPYAGTVRSEPRLRTALERGEPPAAAGRGSLAVLCEKLIADVMPASAGAA